MLAWCQQVSQLTGSLGPRQGRVLGRGTRAAVRPAGSRQRKGTVSTQQVLLQEHTEEESAHGSYFLLENRSSGPT